MTELKEIVEAVDESGHGGMFHKTIKVIAEDGEMTIANGFAVYEATDHVCTFQYQWFDCKVIDYYEYDDFHDDGVAFDFLTDDADSTIALIADSIASIRIYKDSVLTMEYEGRYDERGERDNRGRIGPGTRAVHKVEDGGFVPRGAVLQRGDSLGVP